MATRPGSFITIIDDADVIHYQHKDEESGLVSASIIDIVPLTEETKERLLKKHTVSKVRRGVPVERTNWRQYTIDVLDLSIVGWSGVYKYNRDPEAPKVEIPCLRETKAKLPDTIKGEIVKIAVGRELPSEELEEEESKNDSAPTSNGNPR